MHVQVIEFLGNVNKINKWWYNCSVCTYMLQFNIYLLHLIVLYCICRFWHFHKRNTFISIKALERVRPWSLPVFPCHMQVEEMMGSAVPGLFLLLLFLAPECWAGDCKGHRQILRGPPGYITDGPGNYSVNGNCEWLITGECQKKLNWIHCFFPTRVTTEAISIII